MNLETNSILGIEVKPDKIKIMEASLTAKGFEVMGLDRLDVPANSIKEGIIVEPKLVAEKLSDFIKKNKISAKQIIALLNPPYVFTRIIRLPFNLTDEQIRLNLEAELQSYRSFADKDNIIDFKKLEEISEEGVKKINVLFAATTRQLSESYLKTAQLANLDLLAVDVPMLSVLRCLNEVDFSSSSLEVTLLILVGERYLDMCILKGNRPRFLHSVEIDMFDFERNRVDFIDRFISAIKLVVNFYQARFIQGERITRIVINPQETRFAQIHPLLKEKLSPIDIQISSPLARIHLKPGPGISEDLRFDFCALLGAVKRIENKDEPFNLNLLLEQRIRRQHKSNQMYILFISLTLILTAAIISLGWVILKINIIQRKISNLTLRLEVPHPQLNKAMSVKQKKDIINKQIAEASWIMQNIKKPVYFKNITKSATLVPYGLWLIDVTLDESQEYLTITAEARTEKPIFDYIALLSTSNYFNSVELASSSAQTETIKFVIQCKIK